MKSAFLAMMAVASVVLVGCGPDTSHLPKTVLVEGIVTLNGNPVEDASVVLVPDPKGAVQSGQGAASKTDADGRFSLNAFDEKPGAVPGDYLVKVNKTLVEQGDANEEIGTVNVSYGLPKKYASISTSGLTLKVGDSDMTDVAFELEE